MKYINKSEEPESFTAWKELENDDWKPSWNNFSKPHKTDVHNSLLQEQGCICCYCGRLITIDSSHIEHLQPRTTYPQLSLDYTNLLASCQKDTVPKEPLHCGKKKDKWYDKKLMVSPLDINCGEFFRYTEDGQILSTENPEKALAAQTTIDKLDLNIDKLKKMRIGAIEAILEGLEDLTDNEREILLQRFSQSDGNGQNEEFCAAIVYILKQYI
ncbi:retron system putative HNH endonuclease [Anabaena cylindrica UHCC 0172]|uniref:retron system putative HNH endonuclease n=1 Tax=Anabaena cylindrica TaxID=1165 RepID=UPI002B20CD6B|nr:retron system putative HNH endonuclease [Anabaena cylindrica]MEA5551562.1 retron system putative HNH endonuclease [Anabaena cylindrica UHCC 0172]